MKCKSTSTNPIPLEAPPGTRSMLGYLMIDLSKSSSNSPASPINQPLSRRAHWHAEVVTSRVATAPLNSALYLS